MLKPTEKSLQGELYSILKSFHLPYSKMYSKEFYTTKFMKKLRRMLWLNLQEYDVTLIETEEDFILEVRK